MKKSLTKKVLDTLTDIMEKEREKYLEFWKEFGPAIKEGVTGDFENREKLLPLLVFQSSNDPEKLTSLDEYIGRMKEGQDTIYYINGETRSIAENSPHLEALKNKGYEVLFLLEPIDEIVTQYVNEYKDKKLKSASKGELDLGDKKEKEKTEKELKKKTGEFESLLKFIQEKLSGHVKEVKLSSRLVSAPACVVGADFDMSPYLEKLLQKEKQGNPAVKRTLELNPEHPVVVKMNERFQADAADPVLGDYAELLFDYAILSDGGTLPDPVKFNKLVVELIAKNI
jgi:molecular chaperone HtpG